MERDKTRIFVLLFKNVPMELIHTYLGIIKHWMMNKREGKKGRNLNHK